MYLDFFGLKLKPFELVPNPIFLFLSRSHRSALSHLEYGIREGAGFIMLTGEVGSGKTILVRDMLRRLEADTSLAMIFNTMVSSQQLLAMINEEFGLSAAGKDKVALLRDLNEFLISRFEEECRPVIIIDEAQNLSPDALEEIRLLSNLEAEDSKLLQIVFVGQPEFKQIIGRPELRQLRQRIGIRCHLQPLTQEETFEYILHRLEVAGNRDAVIFSEGTVEAIHRSSGGIPRLINTFCDFLLLSACIEEKRELTLEMVEEVLADASDSIQEIDVEEPDIEKHGDGEELLAAVADLTNLVRRQRHYDHKLQGDVERITTLLDTLPERIVDALRDVGIEGKKHRQGHSISDAVNTFRR